MNPETPETTTQEELEIIDKVFFTGSDGERVCAVTFSDGSSDFFVLRENAAEPQETAPAPEPIAAPEKPPIVEEISKLKVPFGYVRAAKVNGRKEIQKMTGVNKWEKITASEARYLIDAHSSSFGSFLKRHAAGTDLQKIFNSLA